MPDNLNALVPNPKVLRHIAKVGFIIYHLDIEFLKDRMEATSVIKSIQYILCSDFI